MTNKKAQQVNEWANTKGVKDWALKPVDGLNDVYICKLKKGKNDLAHKVSLVIKPEGAFKGQHFTTMDKIEFTLERLTQDGIPNIIRIVEDANKIANNSETMEDILESFSFDD